MSSLEIKIMLFLQFVFVIQTNSAESSKCDLAFKLQCDDGSCIDKFKWCDVEIDCVDYSDEMYCNGKTPCRDIHFECENKKCIPVAAVCDEYDDCHDGSDEKNCNSSVWSEYVSVDHPIHADSPYQNFSSDAPAHFRHNNEVAVEKAIEYLLNMRNSDYGWGAFTPRAVVALSMASRVSAIARKYIQLSVKQLNIQLIQELIKNRNTTLSKLSLYINALYATCQDPRNFQGMDLISRLRRDTDIAMESNTTIPLAFLTLCLSNTETKYEDKVRLADFYNSNEKRTGARALAVLAMICIHRKDGSNIFGNYVSDFFTGDTAKNAKIADIYTKALFKQASIAAGYFYPDDLASMQLPDGSFGDLLSTYYTIPVLLNSSFLDMVCVSRSKKLISENEDKTKGKNEVTYSLWITNGKDPISHSTTVRFYGKKSIFDIMTMAATRDPLYRFLYEEFVPEGKKVYSLAGIPNDIESGTSWSLYFTDADNARVNSLEGLTLLDSGVDQYFPDDKSHLIFWFKRNVPTITSLQVQSSAVVVQ